MSTYLNSVVKRTAPLTRCQCAVLAVLDRRWSTLEEIWKREPVYLANQFDRVRPVAYGTIAAILRGLVQQGFAESQGGKRNKQYRSKSP